MSTSCARSVLCLIAITTMLIGATMSTMTAFGILAWEWATIAVPNRSWSGERLDVYAMLAHASIVAWGILVFALSSRLAGSVASEPDGT